MAKKAEIKKIVLDLDGEEISLTPDQAKKLHGSLNELFGEKQTPIIIDRRRWWWEWPTVTWTSTDGTTGISYQTNSSTLKMSV